MKITKAKLKQVIKEELDDLFDRPNVTFTKIGGAGSKTDLPFTVGTDEGVPEEGSVAYHIQDAIQMLQDGGDEPGTTHLVIRRLEEALSVLANDPDYNRIDDMD